MVDSARIQRQIQHALRDSHPTVRFIALDLFRFHPASFLEPQVICLLNDKNLTVKMMAVAVCGQMNIVAAVDELLTLINSTDFILRQLAVQALGRLDVAGIPTFLPNFFLQESAPGIRKIMVSQLGKLNPPPWDLLLASAQDADVGIRLETAKVLGDLAPDQHACKILLKFLEQESNTRVFATLLLSLGRFEDKIFLDFFRHSLKHQESRIRANAVEAMGKLPLALVEPVIVPFLQDPSNRVRANVIGVFLQHLPATQMQQHIRSLLGSHNPWEQASGAWLAGTFRLSWLFPELVRLLGIEEPAVAARTAWAIGKLDQQGSFADLTRLYGTSHSHTQANILEAMGSVARFENTRVLAGLIGREPNPQLRARMLDMLSELRAVEAYEQVLPLCKDSDLRVRSRALAFMGELLPQKATELMVFALNDSQPAIRHQCALQLLRLGDFRGLKTMVQCLSDPEKERMIRHVQETTAPAAPTATMAQ